MKLLMHLWNRHSESAARTAARMGAVAVGLMALETAISLSLWFAIRAPTAVGMPTGILEDAILGGACAVIALALWLKPNRVIYSILMVLLGAGLFFLSLGEVVGHIAGRPTRSFDRFAYDVTVGSLEFVLLFIGVRGIDRLEHLKVRANMARIVGAEANPPPSSAPR